MDESNRLHGKGPDPLLGGPGHRGEGPHDGLREVLAQITAISTKPPAAEVEDAHLRRMIELARGGSQPGLARVLAEVTAFSTKQPSSTVTTAHLQAMTELAREIAGDPGPRSPIGMTPKRPAAEGVPHRRLALGLVPALAAPLCVVGIALAGVSLPSALRAPFDALGVGLPNQGHRAAIVERASTGDVCASPIAALKHPLRLPGDLCEPGTAKGKRAAHRDHAKAVHEARHRPGGAPGRGEPGREAGVAVAAVGHPGSPATGGSAGGEAPGPPAQAPVAQAPVAHHGPPPGGPGGGGHQGPPTGPGPATPPQSPPQAEPPVNHPPAGPVYPGKGCGDKNHVHEREGECAKPPK